MNTDMRTAGSAAMCHNLNTGLMIIGNVKGSTCQLHFFIVAKDNQSPLHALAASYIIR